MTSEEFEALVVEVLNGFSDEILQMLSWIPVIAEDEPSDDIMQFLKQEGFLRDSQWPLALWRSDSAHGIPPHIRIYRKPVEGNPKRDKKRVVRDLIIHELKHAYNLIPEKHD